MTRWQAIRDGVVIGCVLSLSFQGLRVMQAADRALEAIAAAKPAIVDADTAVKHISTVADDLGGVISAEREAQKKQLTETTKIIAATKEVLVRTDCALNGGPGCKGVLPQARDTIANIQEQSNTIASASQRTFDSASQTLDSLNRRIQDKRIDSLLDGFQVTSLHLEATTANVASMTAHGDHIIAYYDKSLTSPKGFAKTLGQGILQWIVAPGAAIATAVK